MTQLIVTPKKDRGTFEVWSKEDKNILRLDFRPILDFFELWETDQQIVHYRAMPKHLSGWGLLNIKTMTYIPDFHFLYNESYRVRFLAHPDKTLQIRPTNVCLLLPEGA